MLDRYAVKVDNGGECTYLSALNRGFTDDDPSYLIGLYAGHIHHYDDLLTITVI